MKQKPFIETQEGNPGNQNSLPSSKNGMGALLDIFTSKFQGLFGKRKANVESNGEVASAMPAPLTGGEVIRWAMRNKLSVETVQSPGTLIAQGQAAESVYVLLEQGGKAEYTLDENAYHLATLPAESIVGEISALTGETATATVTLEKPMKVLRFSAEEFQRITEDPQLKQRIELLIQKRLLMSADFRERLRIYLDEKEAEKMNATPNKEMEKELSLAQAIQDGLSEDHPIRHDFDLSYMVGNVLGTKKMNVVFTKLGTTTGYSVAITSDGVSISMKFSEDGKTGKDLSGTIDDGRGGGIYSRILRYLLRGVTYIHSSIIEDNTMEFVRANRRDIEKVSSSELAANSPVTAARKGFISNINSMGGLTSYRVDPVLTLILDVATDVERSFLYDENDARLMRLYGTSMDETLNQLTDMMAEYQNSDDYRALPDEARHFCNLQIDRIQELPNKIRSDRRFHSQRS